MSQIYCILKEILESDGISIAQFAKQTGLAYNTVKRLTENNFTSIDLNTMEALCKALDCVPGDFLKRKQEQGKRLITDIELLKIFTQLNIQALETKRSEWVEETSKNFTQLITSLMTSAINQQAEINEKYVKEVTTLAANHSSSISEYVLGIFEEAAKKE